MCAAPAKDQDVIRQFTWEIASISAHLDELRYFWAKKLSISGPQWMIIVALAELDKGDGAPVNAVSKMLHVDSSFVTTQSKLLEKKAFIRRKQSSEDAQDREDVLDRQDVQATRKFSITAGSVERVHIRRAKRW